LKLRFVAPLVALVLPANALQAQPPSTPERRTFAVAAGDASEVVRLDSLISARTRTGELALVSAQPDRQLPRRVHEYFGQLHRGVPVYGAGVTRQRSDGATVSAFGTVFDEIDVDVAPTLGEEAALARLEQVAGAAPATTAPPRLAILPDPTGRLMLTWSAPMRDFRTWFIDAHGGEPVHRLDHVHAENAVGSGSGITGAPQKLSVWHNGHDYEAWDRLRPAEIVTMDARGIVVDIFALLLPSPAWLEAVALDDDNNWSKPAIVDGHAHLGFTYDYLLESQGWRGLDGQDGRIFAIANIGEFYNAFFISAPFGPQATGLMAFGAESNDTPLVPLDVVAHEFMHGVTYSSVSARTGLPFLNSYAWTRGPSSLEWQGETYRCGDAYTVGANPATQIEGRLLCADADGNLTPSGTHFALFLNHGGAINEAYSDIVGIAVEHAFHPPGEGPLRADYVLGEDTGELSRRSDAPRSVPIGPAVPGFNYPDSYGQEFRFVFARDGLGRNYLTGLGMAGNRAFKLPGDGYSGVHWNSTILSHAFYLAIEGGQHSSGQILQGVGGPNRLQVEQAFFRAMTELAPPLASYPLMGFLIRQAAFDLHGAGSSAFNAIHQALTAVGL